MTSISNSLHPMSDSSMRISCTGLIERACSQSGMKSSSFSAIEPPMPPSVNDGRMMRGKGMLPAIASASSMLCAMPLLALSYPSDVMISLNLPLSSAFSMASAEAPMTFTPYFPRMPSFSSSIVRLSAVCPPIVERIASGPTWSKILSMYSFFSGSRKIWSAIPGVVMTVAGFGLMSETS